MSHFASSHAADGHALDAGDGRGGGLVEQAVLGVLVDQCADGAQVLVDGRWRRAALLEQNAVALHDGPVQRAATLSKMPGQELAQGGAVAAARRGSITSAWSGTRAAASPWRP